MSGETNWVNFKKFIESCVECVINAENMKDDSKEYERQKSMSIERHKPDAIMDNKC